MTCYNDESNHHVRKNVFGFFPSIKQANPSIVERFFIEIISMKILQSKLVLKSEGFLS